ncbi:VQ motif-containing protein 9 [Hibiscus trionum]|uniref:VQ motif-containing protein 9 n=1 Tax=Hibiscus trionum TaxID=183268 RepID=A0A9W7HHA1_HIBTR|nr:VQ motif-containing protein 9 [Hibiscus trionum]
MEKSCQSSAESTITTSNSTANNLNNRDHYLKHLNKLSHKISKPSTSVSLIRNPCFELPHNLTQAQLPPLPPNPNQSSLQAQQHQPPIYNIKKTTSGMSYRS